VSAPVCLRRSSRASSVALSADGKSVYVASPARNAVAVLRRNTTTGAVFQPAGTGGCVSETGTGGTCQDGKALEGAETVAVSADGKSVYANSPDSNAVAVFAREVPPPAAASSGLMPRDRRIGAATDPDR